MYCPPGSRRIMDSIPAHPRLTRMYGVTNSIAFQAIPNSRNLNYLFFPINFLSLIIIQETINRIMIWRHNIHEPYHEVCRMRHSKAGTPQVPRKTLLGGLYLAFCQSYNFYVQRVQLFQNIIMFLSGT